MKSVDDLISEALHFHYHGRHSDALLTVARFLGDWRRVDSLGKRVGAKSACERLAESIFEPPPLWEYIQEVRDRAVQEKKGQEEG